MLYKLKHTDLIKVYEFGIVSVREYFIFNVKFSYANSNLVEFQYRYVWWNWKKYIKTMAFGNK